MARLKCAIIDDYQNVALSMADWQSISPLVDVFTINEHLAEDALLARIVDCEIVVIMRERTPFSASLLKKLPQLKLLITSGMRNASIDIQAASAQGVTVCGTKSFSEPPGELAWALIFALCRNLPTEIENMRQDRWQTTVGKDLSGSTLGVIGLGKIGRKMASVAKALGMKVNAWSPNLTPERALEGGANWVTKDELFAGSDIVSIHLVMSALTAGIVGRRELELMKPDALFINTSRAGLVDNHALEDLLRSGRIAGAGLDVFDVEPLEQGHAFRNMPNVIATPHLGYVTKRNYASYFEEAVEDIKAYVDGSPVRLLS